MTFSLRRAVAGVTLALAHAGAFASSDPMLDLLSQGEGAGLGLATRVEQSPYRGVGARFDMVPLYLFETEHAFINAWRVGLKNEFAPGFRMETFLTHRFEGFPNDRIPPGLSGMAPRNSGFDFGIGFEDRFAGGTIYGEALHDISGVSRGSEYRAGYRFALDTGAFKIRPFVTAAWRDAKLNNYYYGVLPAEATVTRPGYQAGTGVNGQIGVNARYDFASRWHLLGSLSFTRWSSGVRRSPITDVPLGQASGFLGFGYDFTPQERDWRERGPLIWKAMYGRSTDCNLLPIMRLGCTSTNTTDRTGIAALEIGKPLLKEVNGWPLDFVGYLGLLRHNEKGLQPDSWQADAYVKAFYYGFPWRSSVRTRVGFGAGISYAQRVPFVEQRDQVRRGRPTSKLLNYLAPSIDVNVGDIFGSRTFRDTYFGVGASHRSGIFGNSQVLGNVNGGSNYLYSYLEWQM